MTFNTRSNLNVQ